MTTRTVTTQSELDDALASAAVRRVDITAGVGLMISDTHGKLVDVGGSATIQYVRGSATIQYVRGSATIQYVRDSATIQDVGGSATIQDVGGSATIQDVGGSATIQHVGGSATIQDVGGSATIQHVGGSVIVHALWGRAKVERSARFVCVYRRSPEASVGGDAHVIDMSNLDERDPQTWCDMQGITVEDGHAIVYKAVDDNLRSGRGFAYPVGETVKVLAKEWKADGDCGHGLHFGPTPRHARDYFPEATRFLACRIPLSHASGIPGGTAKIKARSCVVLHEVDLNGNVLTAEAVA